MLVDVFIGTLALFSRTIAIYTHVTSNYVVKFFRNISVIMSNCEVYLFIYNNIVITIVITFTIS